jgi:surfactin synthase thioesterase subunit
VRDVWALPHQGYGPDQCLPSDRAAAVAAHAQNIARLADGKPFTIVGYSAGGLMAHAVTSHLESLGIFPTALVVIDTYLGEADEQTLSTLWYAWMVRFPTLPWTTNEFTASSWYNVLFSGWTAAPIVTPTLFVRVADRSPGLDDIANWRATWTLPHTSIEVPGHHLNVLSDHSDSTAHAIHEWLASSARFAGSGPK